MCYFQVVCSQFHRAKFLCIQHMSVKCLYYSIFMLFLGIHIKGNQKYLISQCEMENQQEPLSDRYCKFYRSRASCFRQFTMLSTIFSAICIYINCTSFKTANLFFKTKKTTSHQAYKGYSGRHCII